MSHERFEPDETLTSIDEGRNAMPKTKAGSSEQFEKGDDMKSIGESAASSPKAKRLPELPTEAPNKIAVVYASYYAPEAEPAVLKEVAGRDVVLVVRGPELASYFAKRFKDECGTCCVIDFWDAVARERYLSWLGELANEHPQVEVVFAILGLHPESGEPFLQLGQVELTAVLELALKIFTPPEVDDEPASGRPAELWLEIPLDAVSRWAKGKRDGSAFEVPAERGTLRVELGQANPDRRTAQFHIFRRDTGESVAHTHILRKGEPGASIDSDVFDALAPFPEDTRVILRTADRGDSEGHQAA